MVWGRCKMGGFQPAMKACAKLVAVEAMRSQWQRAWRRKTAKRRVQRQCQATMGVHTKACYGTWGSTQKDAVEHGVHTKGCCGTRGAHKRMLWDRLLGRCAEQLSITKEINAQEI